MITFIALSWALKLDHNWFLLRWCDSQDRLDSGVITNNSRTSVVLNNGGSFLTHMTCACRVSWALCCIIVIVIMLKCRLTGQFSLKRESRDCGESCIYF